MMLRYSIAFLVLTVAIPTIADDDLAVDAWPPASSVLASIEIPRPGDPITVKTRIGRVDTLLLFDTGFTFTVIDRAILPRVATPIRDLAIRQKIPGLTTSVYKCPSFSAEGIDCPWLKEIPAADLSAIREMTGGQWNGVLGMDFISRHVIHLDLDRKLLLICDPKKVGDAPRDGTILTKSAAGIPVVPCLIGKSRVWCEIDFGDFGNGSLTRDAVYEQLGLGTATAMASPIHSVDVGGSETESISIRCHSLECGGVECRDISFPLGAKNQLGLHTLARFVTTLDFVKGTAHFRPSKRVAIADRWHALGLEFAMESPEALKVLEVSPRTIGMQCGFEANDEIVEIDKVPIAKMVPAHLFRALYFPASEDISFGIIRGGKNRQILVPGGK
jgi:hypothetical protein